MTRCANTKVGNQLIRGVSGGERKRTSIGVELLINPTLLFLDEPTTGLDSSTALQIVELLKNFSLKGVNVISTIHQPSSEIFDSFERLVLMQRGNIIYQGDAHESVKYFSQLGLPCPDYQNPSDYFMKLMNEEGLIIEHMQKQEENIPEAQIQKEYQERMSNILKRYKETQSPKDLDVTCKYSLKKNDDSYNVSAWRQFILLLWRAFINEIRNPMDVRLKIMQSIVFALASLIVFSNLGEHDQKAIQNRNGCLFFITTMQAFASFQGSIAVFSAERNLFLRERLNKSYGVGP